MTTVNDGTAPGTKRRALGRGLDALLPRGLAAAQLRPTAPSSSARSRRSSPQRGQPRPPLRAEGHRRAVAVHPRARRRRAARRAQGRRRHASSSSRASVDGASAAAGGAARGAGRRQGRQRESQAFELALIENVQREDLNAIELAEAFDRLVREHGYTQEALADPARQGPHDHRRNALRLLKLPPRVRDEGHRRRADRGARARAARRGRTRRDRGAGRAGAAGQAERAGDRGAGPRPRGQGEAEEGRRTARRQEPAIRDLEARLTRALGTKVEVRDRGNKGEVAIPYADLDALDRLIDKLV